jgi:hypothetical protein
MTAVGSILLWVMLLGLRERCRRLSAILLQILNLIEPVIKVVLILDGTERCHVGFLPRHVVARHEGVRLHNKFAQIIELYEDTLEGYMKNNKSKRNHGMSSYVLFDNIPNFE